MSGTGEQTTRALELRRERVVDLLCRHVATDALSLDEFERRVDHAHRALSLAALDALVADLPAIGAAGATPGTHTSQHLRTQPGVERRESQVMVAIMSGTTRKGPWVPARRSTVIAMMGGAELDFREAVLPPGVTEITVVAVMGGAEIIVPPGLAVECDGVGIMGGFDYHTPTGIGSGAAVPTLRIKGVALMGGVEVVVRLPGESAADARRRQRQELRDARKEQRRLNRDSRGGEGWGMR
jgi:hypothetical protein